MRRAARIALTLVMLSCGGGHAVRELHASRTAAFPEPWPAEKPSDSARASSAPSASAPQPANSGPSTAPATGAFVSATPQLAAYALVIGIERYRDAPAATGARADAERFAAVARKTLGIRQDRIILAVDDRATKSDIEGHLAWLESNVTAGSRIYVFYSGHGAPEIAGGAPYLFPYDANPKSVTTSGIPLSVVMTTLARTKAKDGLVILDSCFSGGGGRSVLPPGARPLMRVKMSAAAPQVQVALFTAAGADEIAGPALGGGLGLFSKYVTDGIGTAAADTDGDGQISLQELADWVKPRVMRDAKTDSRDQTPTLTVGSGVGGAQNFSVAWGLPSK